jgi:uncharacterized protein YlxP (DUF503 family)
VPEAQELSRRTTSIAGTIGVACVSNSAPHASDVLESVVGFIEADRLDLEVTDYAIEVTHAF